VRLPPRYLLVRDSVVCAVTLLACVTDRVLRAQGHDSFALGVLTGGLLAVTGFLMHEWGHLAGSLATGSVVHYPPRALAPLLFHFDVRKNDRRQFLAMSYGGYAGTFLGVLALVSAVDPRAWSGRVGLFLTAVGVAVTLIAEVPTTVRVARGGALPDGFAFRPPR
jgi:hypothetical protein